MTNLPQQPRGLSLQPSMFAGAHAAPDHVVGEVVEDRHGMLLVYVGQTNSSSIVL